MKVAPLTIAAILVIGLLALIVWQWPGLLSRFAFAPTQTSVEQGLTELPTALPTRPATSSDESAASTEPISIVADNLDIPWEVAWLPDGTMLITERPGTLLAISNGERTSIPLPDTRETGESGLLGLAVHPRFNQTNWLYLYRTTPSGQALTNRVERYTLRDNQLTERTVLISDIPGAQFHDGGRIAFGPDGYLYITTGDATEPELAQDRDSPAGKILRLSEDGQLPPDNPFNTPIYSWGHRNPQGLAWDAAGRLWATEHGRSGAQSGLDEINLIKPGQNYGWPTIEGDATAPNLVEPVMHSGASDTWAPAGAAIIGNKLFFTGLRGESLYEATIQGENLTNLKQHFRQQFGRLRAVTVGPDGALYISSSNTDGRGTVQANDDKIIRLNPSIFE